MASWLWPVGRTGSKEQSDENDSDLRAVVGVNPWELGLRMRVSRREPESIT